ncbi:hypothetical protein [Moraxella cuniculi]|uniref:hypothetical protein n=1 Tax=Moraxella cuniculi TaxID=34061 RepID=UPI001D176BCE|nr:hypothetical protein [Moraxella cuniculi]
MSIYLWFLALFSLATTVVAVPPKKTTPKTPKVTTTAPQTQATKPNSEKSTGRTVPKNLKEKLAMEEVKANPRGTTPARMPAMSDAKNGWFAKDGWVKRVQNVNGVEIHYIENTKTGEKTDFKLKD